MLRTARGFGKDVSLVVTAVAQRAWNGTTPRMRSGEVADWPETFPQMVKIVHTPRLSWRGAGGDPACFRARTPTPTRGASRNSQGHGASRNSQGHSCSELVTLRIPIHGQLLLPP